MPIRIIFLVALLLSSTVQSAAQSEAARASRTWEVSRYSIKAVLPDSDASRQASFVATLSLRNVSQGSASGLTLRISPSAEVAGVSINGTRFDFSKGEEKVGGGSLQRVIVRGLSVPSGGTLTAEVSYVLKVDENSGLASISDEGSQFLPLGYWYPTPTSWLFARGADFAATDVQVSGGLARRVIAPGKTDGKVFISNLKIQPFFLSGDWELVEDSGVEMYLPKGSGQTERDRAKGLAVYAAGARRHLASVFGSDFEGPLKIVAVRRGGGFSGGGVVLIDEGALRREKLDSQTAVVVADAIAKAWLGNVAEVSGDGYGVIREGLARYLATRFIETEFGPEVAEVERLRQRTAYGAISRRDGPITQISPIDDFYFSAMTNKGAVIWRRIEREVGTEKFLEGIRRGISSGRMDLPTVKSLFADQKTFLDYAFDEVTDGNLMAGLPQQISPGTWRVALRNTGPVPVTIAVVGTDSGGKSMRETATIPARGFSEATFRSESDIVRVEIDPDKLELQSDYSDDVSPRMFGESDLVLLVKASFDKQDFVTAERDSRTVLARFARFDDVRILLARALLARGEFSEAKKEFTALLDERLPSARALAWGNVGLGEIAARDGRVSDAARHFENAVRADAELGATVAARRGRRKAGVPAASAEGVREFFTVFDKAAVSNRKAEVDSLVMPGEIVRFSRGIAGQAQEWQTTVTNVQIISPSTLLVEVDLTLRMINKNPETGSAVFRLQRSGGSWKIASVDSFEVR